MLFRTENITSVEVTKDFVRISTVGCGDEHSFPHSFVSGIVLVGQGREEIIVAQNIRTYIEEQIAMHSES